MPSSSCCCPDLVIARTTQRVGEAIATLQEYSISQLPVSERPDGDALEGFVGSITEKGLLDRAFRDPSIVERTVGEVMDRPRWLVGRDRDERQASDRRRDQARRARVPGASPVRPSMTVPPIPTARFELVSMSMTFMERLVARDLAGAEAEIGAIVPEDLPDILDHFLQFRIADLSLDPGAQP